MAIEELDRANTWIYRPNANANTNADANGTKKELDKHYKGGEIFERVHITKGGAWILEDTKGEVVVVRVVDL